MARTWTEEQKNEARERMKQRWEGKQGPSPTGPPAAAPPVSDSVTEQTRSESSARLHDIIEKNRLRPGEPNPVPPDPPPNYGMLPEYGKGGALSQQEREIGVDPDKIAAKQRPPDVVRRRDEPEPIPIREDLAPLPAPVSVESSEDETILRIPNWDTLPLEDAESWLQMLRTEEDRGATIINRRHGESSPINLCANPACRRPVADGKEAFSKTIQDPVTKIFHRLVLCSVRCWTIWQKGPGVPRSNPPGANLSSRDR